MMKNVASDSLQAEIGQDLQRLAPSGELLVGVLAEMVRLNGLFVQCLSALPLRLLLVDEQRRVLAASRLCLEEVLHTRQEDVLEKPLAQVLGLAVEEDTAGNDDIGHDTARNMLADLEELLLLEAAMDGGQPWSGSLRGSWVRMQPLYTYEQQAAVLVFEDKQGERLKRLARLEQSERLVQMGQLSGGLAHELKNALQNIAGIMQILQFKYMKDEGLQRSLGLALEELEAAGGLLGGFLGMSRLDMQVGVGSLNQVVREALQLAYGSCHINRIEIAEALAEDLPHVYMDKSRIKQVIINCLDNGREAILAKRSQADNGIDHADDEVGHIRVCTSFDKDKEQLVLTIEDDGIGLGQEEAANFFKPFFTTKEQGTGMGTSISAAIVRMHGGDMEAAGELGVGSCVTVRLPLQSRLPADKQDLYAEIAELGL